MKKPPSRRPRKPKKHSTTVNLTHSGEGYVRCACNKLQMNAIGLRGEAKIVCSRCGALVCIVFGDT